MRISIVLCALTLAACGGGGGGETSTGSTQPPTTPQPTPTTPAEPTPPRESETHSGAWLQQDNESVVWYANLQIDLPRHGRDGLQVERPTTGGAAVADVTFSDSFLDRLEPSWRYDSEAQERLLGTAVLINAVANRAYLQWTRHLDRDFGTLALQVGAEGSLDCGHSASGCYIGGEINAVVLSDNFLRTIHQELWRTITQNPETPTVEVPAVQALFWLISHEAGHQFGYDHPQGDTDGCGNGDRCHGPIGSGSVMSYDAAKGLSVRYSVTEDDISYIPKATWNGDDTDRYTVWQSGTPPSISGWGVWIDHRFDVGGRTAPGQTWGGNPSYVDEIIGSGWVRGTPSGNVSLAGTATWSGEDNFLGVDLDQDYLGALLRADANLRYTFGDRPNLNLRVNEFEAHFAIDGIAAWHDHNYENWGDFSYSMDCTSGGCSGESAEAKWYANDAGDPSGWVGGVVSDQDNGYAGSFVAEKD